MADFEEAHNATLQFLALGDAGEALNKIILSKDAPLADLFFGVDNTFLSRALDADIFAPYESPLLAQIPDELKLDPEHRLVPVDYGFVNINADTDWFDERDLALPTTLEDLAKPEYAGFLVVQNPATSSPGLAFLLATIVHFGEDGYLDFWRALRDNDVLIVDGWSEAYFEHFTAGCAGAATGRWSSATPPAHPPMSSTPPMAAPNLPASISIYRGAFRQIEFAGILAGTQQLELAQALIDFLLDRRFQDDIPLQMFVYPANPTAALPEVFTEFGPPPPNRSRCRLSKLTPTAKHGSRRGRMSCCAEQST